jgi:hypothetical protein
MVHRPRQQPDARRRHGFDEREFADFNRGAVGELNLGASVLGAKAIALDERHVADRGLAFAVALERRGAFDEGNIRRRRVLCVSGTADGKAEETSQHGW